MVLVQLFKVHNLFMCAMMNHARPHIVSHTLQATIVVGYIPKIY